MARLVAAFGSSHSIMLVSQREDWQHGFRVIDPKNPHYYDRAGNPTSYEQLLAIAPQQAEAMVTPEKMGERFDAAEAAMDELRDRIRAARLDVLIVVGDDQTELFRTTNNPTFAIYYGETIRNAQERARRQRRLVQESPHGAPGARRRPRLSGQERHGEVADPRAVRP